MRIIVVGCGSIGLRHIANLLNLGTNEILACDTSSERRSLVKSKYGLSTFATLRDALQSSVEAALICSPTYTHVPLARNVLEAGLHVFVEKPISNTLDGVPELIDLAERNHRILLIGHNMRFDPSIISLRELVNQNRIGRIFAAYAQGGHYLPQWRAEQDYRTVYSGHKEQGGGVTLDYLHDFDYLRWILGEAREVFCIADKLSDLDIDSEDHAVILMRMETGAFATLQADYLRRRKWRSLELVGEKGIVKWEASGKSPQLSRITLAYSNEDVEKIYEAEVDLNQEYEAEMKHFVACLEGREKPKIPGVEGMRSLALALAAQRSNKLGNWVCL